MAFAFPEPSARYLYSGEVFNFATEYFHVPGSFEIGLWDMDFQVEGETEWRSVFHWRVTHHNGSLANNRNLHAWMQQTEKLDIRRKEDTVCQPMNRSMA